MISRYIRFFIVLILALVMAGVSLFVVNAQSDIPNPPSTDVIVTADNCASCHSDTYEMWHKGGHGDVRANDALDQQGNCLACHKAIPDSSMSNNVVEGQSFKDYWTDKGRPNNCLACHVTGYDPTTDTWKSEGISCVSCHNPIPASHPNESMPVDKNSDLCSTCHTGDRFGWDTWRQSIHFQNNMTCTNCHNPHSTSVKQTGQSEADTSSLCENCHKDMAQSAIHSNHIKSGATCITCHIGSSKGADDFHKVPDHDFKPKLEACNGCHADQMHSVGSPTIISASQVIPVTGDEVSADAEPSLTVSPGRVNPFGIAGVAAVLGIIGGMVWSKAGKRRIP
jgi:predicted CXXCH cytochrome family protein